MTTTGHVCELITRLLREVREKNYTIHGAVWTEGEGENERSCINISLVGDVEHALTFCCGRSENAGPEDTHCFVYARCMFGDVAVLTTRRDPRPQRKYCTMYSAFFNDPYVLEEYTPEANRE